MQLPNIAISFRIQIISLCLVLLHVVNMHSMTCRRDLEGRWGEESDQYMDKVMDSVLKAVDDGGSVKDRYGFR